MLLYRQSISEILPATIALSLLAVCQPALAGPPLNTDDTGVIAKNTWEFILGFTGDTRDVGDEFAAPVAEVTYGVADDAQLTLGVQRVLIKTPGSKSRSALGAAQVGYKKRLFRNDNFTLVVTPAYSFPVTGSSTDRGIIENVRSVSLPVVASYATGPWEFTGELNYEATSSGPNGTFTGLSAAYGLNERLALLAEVYQTRVTGRNEDESGWTLGVEFGVGESSALLFSVGGALSSDLSAAEELDRAFFIGFLHETG